MSGVFYVDGAEVDATSGRMLLTLTSGGDPFRFHIPPHVAIDLRETIMRDGWQVCCAPDADTVSLAARRAKARRDARAKQEAE